MCRGPCYLYWCPLCDRPGTGAGTRGGGTHRARHEVRGKYEVLFINRVKIKVAALAKKEGLCNTSMDAPDIRLLDIQLAERPDIWPNVLLCHF